MSKYLLDKFLYTVDRDPELVERYRDEPVETVTWWEQEMASKLLNCTSAERTTWLAFTDGRAGRPAAAGLRRAVRARCAPVPDPDAVHRHVRT